MSAITKILLGIVIASGILVIGYGLGVSQNNSPNIGSILPTPYRTPTAARVTAPPRTPTATPSGQNQVKEALVNKTFVIEGVEYTVESSADLGDDLSKSNGASGYGMGKSNGGKFVLVKFATKNVGNAATSLQSIAIFLTDSAGRKYSPVGFADGVTLYIEEYEQFSNSDSYHATAVKPGILKKLFIVAEVASDSHDLRIIIANQKDQNYAVRLSL